MAKRATNDLDGLGIKNHEQVGAAYLRTLGFPEKIATLVEGHVQAKRYLCFRRPEYLFALSEASHKTLMLQGGIMSLVEAIEFEKNPLVNVMVKMREWDDLAKMVNMPVMDFQILREKMLSFWDWPFKATHSHRRRCIRFSYLSWPAAFNGPTKAKRRILS